MSGYKQRAAGHDEAQRKGTAYLGTLGIRCLNLGHPNDEISRVQLLEAGGAATLSTRYRPDILAYSGATSVFVEFKTKPQIKNGSRYRGIDITVPIDQYLIHMVYYMPPVLYMLFLEAEDRWLCFYAQWHTSGMEDRYGGPRLWRVLVKPEHAYIPKVWGWVGLVNRLCQPYGGVEVRPLSQGTGSGRPCLAIKVADILQCNFEPLEVFDPASTRYAGKYDGYTAESYRIEGKKLITAAETVANNKRLHLWS